MSEIIYKIMKENKFEIVNEISRELRCNICNELMIKACSAPCGCSFCSDCIKQYLDGDDKFCPGTSRYCQKKMINYANDIVTDNRANIKISEIIVKCPRQNREFEDELQMIGNHMRTCVKRPINCPFNAIGCKVNEVMNDEMKTHLNEDNYWHSKLLIDLINNLLNEMESMKNEIIEIRENSQLKQKVDNIELQSASQQKICEMENREEIEQLNEEMAVLKDDNRRLRSEIGTNAQSITAMRQQIGMIETEFQLQIYELKQNHQQQQQQLNNEVEMLRRETETLKRIIDGKINDLELGIVDMKKRFINTEICGEFEWKINNLSQQERDKWIYSKSFYSVPEGYRMCLSVNIDDKSGIYVGFHLMRGDSDGKLEWPFKYAVTVDVIDTANGEIWNTETIKYSDWLCAVEWRKPTKAINKIIYVYEYPNYIPLNAVPTSNNRLLMKCRVEREK